MITREEIKEALINGVQGDGDFASEYQIDASTDSVVNVIVTLLEVQNAEIKRLNTVYEAAKTGRDKAERERDYLKGGVQ